MSNRKSLTPFLYHLSFSTAYCQFPLSFHFDLCSSPSNHNYVNPDETNQRNIVVRSRNIRYIILILMLIKVRRRSKIISHNAMTFLNIKLFQTSSMGWSYQLLPAPTKYLSRITYFNLLKNILGKLNSLVFFPCCYTISLTTDLSYLEWLSSIEFCRKKNNFMFKHMIQILILPLFAF